MNLLSITFTLSALLALAVGCKSQSKNVASAVLPFQLNEGLVSIKVSVNGTGPYAVGLDTGGILSLSPRLAARLNLPNEGKEDIIGAGESVTPGWWTTIDDLRLGKLRMHKQRALVYGYPDGNEAVYGVGSEIFQHFVIQINYQTRRLQLFRHEDYRFRGEGTVLPLEFAGDAPVVTGTIDGIAGKFLLDNGSTRSLLLFTPFCERHDLYSHYPAGMTGIVAQGIGGPLQGRVVRAQRLTLGNAQVNLPVTILSQMRNGATAEPNLAGSIGQGILKRFIATFDYPQKQLILEPSADHNRPDVYDRAGIFLNREKGAVMVEDVVKGGPADAAGVQVGDRVLSIGNQNAQRVNDLRAPFLRAVGSKVRLHLRSCDGQERYVGITLRDLIEQANQLNTGP